MSMFNYCPLIWMFCCKGAHALINKTHHRALKARYCNFTDSFESLLSRSNSIKIHERNLKLMLIEVFKSEHKFGPEILHNTFVQRQLPYQFRTGNTFIVPSMKYINSFDFRAAMTWNKLPKLIKNVETLSEFESNLTKLKLNCRCSMCR